MMMATVEVKKTGVEEGKSVADESVAAAEVGDKEEVTLKLVSVEQCVMGWVQSGGTAGRAILPETRKWITEWVAYEDAAEVKVSAMLQAPSAFFVRRCLTAVFAGLDGQHVNALKIMNGLLDLADTELRASAGTTEDYVEGTLNILRTHRREVQRYFGITDGRTRSKLACCPKSLDELSDGARAVVFGHKTVFFRYVGAKGELLESLAQKAIKLDQKRAEFFHILHGVLRSRRHSSEVRYRNAPDDAEISAISNAFKLAEDTHLLEDVKVSIAKAMFDILKQRNTAVQIGPIVCETRTELKEKLKGMALEIGDEPKASVRALLAAAFILGDRRLGYNECRDTKKSREYLDKALALWPSNAKTLTRLGKFLLFEEKDVEGAREKFKAAMESDPSDSVSALSFYWVEGRSCETDAVKDFCPQINSTLASAAAATWASHVLLDFGVLKGLAYLRSGALKAGLGEWGKAQALSHPYFMVKMFSLHSAVRNNGWEFKGRAKKEGSEDEWEDKVRPMGGNDVERILRKYFAKEQEEETFKELADILKNVSLARRKPGEDDESSVQNEAAVTAKSGVVWRGVVGKATGEADKDNNWRARKNGGDENERQGKKFGDNRRPWRENNKTSEATNKDGNNDELKTEQTEPGVEGNTVNGEDDW